MLNIPLTITKEYANAISEQLFNLGEHALVGISPFNSYFSESNLEKLFRWALDNFQEINIFIPDEVSVYTFQAIGYPEDKAKRKTRRQDNYLKNKAIKALVSNTLSETEARNKIICLSDLMHNGVYVRLYNDCLNLYKNDENFRNGCITTSKWVLDSKYAFDNVSNESLDIAVKYFLSEFPLFINSHDILNVHSSLFIYKEIPDFLKKVYGDDSLVSPNQGYIAINLQ
ncbi:cyclo(L-leucyl-L-leucyl) synthase [Alphaproteobacteria bacterium]|nr:cyclo(L-leucyl-L-leucyl) synthase [Alphaproteobacteria bacterium]